jgi:hypothetical protein
VGASNNAQGQNAGARQQINQQTTQAMQRLMQYLQANPNPLQGAAPPTPPPQQGGLPGTAGGSIASISPQSAVTQPGMGGVSGGPQSTLGIPQQMQIPPQLLQQLQRPGMQRG